MFIFSEDMIVNTEEKNPKISTKKKKWGKNKTTGNNK
jgi:hypothetical protein